MNLKNVVLLFIIVFNFSCQEEKEKNKIEIYTPLGKVFRTNIL